MTCLQEENIIYRERHRWRIEFS